MWNEIRYAVRALARESGFTVICVVMLALGIGANTAIFSIVDGVLLRPLRYREPDRLVSLREILPSIAQTYPSLPVSARHFMEWRQRCSSFSSLSAIMPRAATLTGVGEPERLRTARISANLFDTLGVQPAMGRSFLAGEDGNGRDRVAIITHALWKRAFRADPNVVGRTILLDNAAHVIVGVLPEFFRFPAGLTFQTSSGSTEQPQAFKPIVFSDDELKELMGVFNYSVGARLKPGVTRETALAELNVVAAQLEKLAGEKVNLTASVTSLQESLVGRSRRGLVVLLGAVGAVLLIVCVNLANLMLVRSERRARDWAIRTALGATGGRLVRLVLIETLMIAGLGGVFGVALAAGILDTLIRNAPADIQRLDEVHLDARVMLFAFAITMFTGVLFGLAPAWRSTHMNPQSTLKSAGRTSAGGRQGTRFRAALVSTEVGLSVVLLVMAALLGSSFTHVMRADKGFRAPTVLSTTVTIPAQKYKEAGQRNRFHEQVLQRLMAQQGVLSAGISTALPLTGETWVDAAWVPGDNRPIVERDTANVRFVSADYLATMGIPLVKGRTFSDADRKRNVAILSERLANRLWPGQDAVGRKFARGDNDTYEVIGVSGEVRADVDKAPVAMIYRPYWDESPREVVLVARSSGDPRSIAGAIRAVIRAVDAGVPVPEMRTMQDILEVSVAERRFQMLVAGAFAATALLLAALGIYGVVSYSVARRTNELGVRMALGATPWNLRRMVLVQGITPAMIGLGLGAAAAFGVGQLLQSLLYEVNARDPLTIAAVAAGLGLIAATACIGPARRATKVDPLEALRYE